MNHYRLSILLFGFVLPLFVAAVVVGSFAYLRSKTAASFAQKSSHYTSFESNRLQALAIENQIGKKRAHINNWTQTLREETASTISSHLREISGHVPAKEFQQTSFNRPPSAAGFGSATTQKSVPLELSFRATFRSMQRTFLELESRMPQLQLNELRIDRTPQASNLNFTVNYTAWED